MNKVILTSLLGILINIGFSQETHVNADNDSYNIFDCTSCDKEFFVATNSGLLTTPIGVRIGFLCNTGAYLGTRFGKGEIYYPKYDPSSEARKDSTTETSLFSITGGFIKPIYIKGDYSLYGFVGVGYGQWFDYRQENWRKEGYEVEAGLMTSYKNILINFSANMLNGYKTYATCDFTVGIGYRF